MNEPHEEVEMVAGHNNLEGESDIKDDYIVVDEAEIQEDLKSIEEMQANAPKPKGLRHAVSIHAADKRKRKIKLQTEARKAQRGK